jgi:RNA polymerase sigma-70 factor (ECF subfamily)
MKTRKQIDEDNLYVEQFLAGNAEGFEMLVRKYQNRVLNIVYSLIGKDRESEDIVQEVFLKIYRGLNSFRKRCRFSTWFYRIVVNMTYDFLRKRRNFISNEVILNRSIAGGADPREALSQKEKGRMIQDALVRVPLKFRTALVLKDVEGLSYIDIAGVLRCRIGTVESKIYRARQFLKEEFKSKGWDV